MRPQILNYDRAKRRNVFLKAIVLTTVILLGVAIFRYGPVVRARIKLLIAQQRCLEFDPPDGVVSFWPASPLPPPLSDFGAQTGLFRGYPTLYSQVVFAHRLRNKNGERLVIVSADSLASGEGSVAGPGVSFTSDVILPTTLFRPPARLINESVDPTEPPNFKAPTTRQYDGNEIISVGHLDPADPSAFEIKYRHGGSGGTIRGRLTDGDRIELRDDSKNGEWSNIRPAYWPLANGQ